MDKESSPPSLDMSGPKETPPTVDSSSPPVSSRLLDLFLAWPGLAEKVLLHSGLHQEDVLAAIKAFPNLIGTAMEKLVRYSNVQY